VLHIIDRWRHLGTATGDAEVAALLESAGNVAFDPDGYRIIARRLGRTAPRDIVTLGERRR